MSLLEAAPVDHVIPVVQRKALKRLPSQELIEIIIDCIGEDLAIARLIRVPASDNPKPRPSNFDPFKMLIQGINDEKANNRLFVYLPTEDGGYFRCSPTLTEEEVTALTMHFGLGHKEMIRRLDLAADLIKRQRGSETTPEPLPEPLAEDPSDAEFRRLFVEHIERFNEAIAYLEGLKDRGDPSVLQIAKDNRQHQEVNLGYLIDRWGGNFAPEGFNPRESYHWQPWGVIHDGTAYILSEDPADSMGQGVIRIETSRLFEVA
jgi:hypothetical protein